MNGCVSERRLVALATGEDGDGARAHAVACARCGARLAALERELSLLRQALASEPLPAAAARPPRRWWPIAAAAAVAATAELFALTRMLPAAKPAPTARLRTAGLARDVSAALFAGGAPASASLPPSDTAYFAAALNGGWRCGGLERYGIDCPSTGLEDDEWIRE